MKRLKRSSWLLLLFCLLFAGRLKAQLASFSFSGTPTTVSGWTNLPGDPHSGAQTATVNGITISSIGAANWAPNSVPSNVYNFGGAANATYFPTAVMADTWLQWNGNSFNLALYNASLPQLLLSGLNPATTYILRMSGSDVYYTGNTQYTVAGASVAGSQYLNCYNNTSQGVTFEGVQPDASGTIRVYVSATSTASFSFISGLEVFPGNANVGTPVVALTAPANGTVQSEGGNYLITATATETGGTIAKVEFYADTTKIGEADAAPYTMTWVDPDPGSYQLTAKATDAVGTIATASVNIGVQSLNYYWSTTGNSGVNGDSNFVGTVDSNRLAFRTDNAERMSISPGGTVMVGTNNVEDTLALHGVMTIRDSMAPYPLSIVANSIYSPFLSLSNLTNDGGTSIGTRYYNVNGLVAQFIAGGPNYGYMPNGFLFHDVSGGGFDFASPSFFSWGNTFKVLGGTKMIFYPSAGHLLIGSTTDNGSGLLQVNGNMWSTGLTIPTGANAGYVLTSDVSGNATWQPGGAGGHWLPVGGGVYDSLDNVAIGTSNTQGYKLAVNGSAVFTRVVVKPQANWPDYVFKKGYVLPELDELERFVRAHHHLPGIASGQDIQRSGIDVAEEQTTTLKKVEELTLYLIQENKQLREQNARLEGQQKEIDELRAMIQAANRH